MGSLHLVADQDSQSKSNNMIKFMLFICLMLGGATNVFSHGNMVKPTVWWDKERIGMLSGMQCSSGYSIEDLPAGPGAGSSCFWFTNDTLIPHSPTLDDSLRTYRDVYVPGFGPVDISARNPWRAPGSAAVFSPCGNAGGNPDGCPIGSERSEGFDCPGGGGVMDQMLRTIVLKMFMSPNGALEKSLKWHGVLLPTMEVDTHIGYAKYQKKECPT